MRDKRPKNLNLLTIRFPLTAIASILHRVSGFILFLMIPLLLWALQNSLTYSGFDTLQSSFSDMYVKIFFWLLFLPFTYHLLAGLRHLMSDLHIGNSRKGGKIAVLIVFSLFALLAISLGVWLW